MNQETLKESLEREVSLSFVKSGGPGGQNVNKLNTKVFASINLSTLEGLSPEEKEIVRTTLYSKINSNGILSLSADEERTQYRNREIALARLFSLISEATHVRKKRIPTKPGKKAKIKRHLAKNKQAQTKNLRKKPLKED
jgi:ribosome-associated protein